MIDWLSVGANFLWILGLAVLLAAVSYQQWRAGVEGRSLVEQLGAGSFLSALYVGLFLIACGLAATTGRWWETLLWLAFALANLILLYRQRRAPEAEPEQPPPERGR